MDKSIRVSEETHSALKALKGDNETFDELLSRMIQDRRETIQEGAGLWSGTDAGDAAREAREEMKEGMRER